MRFFGFLLTLFIFLIGCKEEETGFTSLIGEWKYTTPDEKIEITFDIVGGGTELLTIKNHTIKIDGSEGNANIQFSNVTETSIDLIRINANDAGLIYPYNIAFNNLSASPDFTIIEVESASYTYPWPNTITLDDIQIVRR
ncbi:MAG TPA: hypothetical protein VIS49_10035 [Cyclobacteriaceae bacterium]